MNRSLEAWSKDVANISVEPFLLVDSEGRQLLFVNEVDGVGEGPGSQVRGFQRGDCSCGYMFWPKDRC